jgi:tetratricopeptide (TPR) repeat protein
VSAVLLLALAVPPESADARRRFRECVDLVREAGVEACRRALEETSLSARHRALALGLLAGRLADQKQWDEAARAEEQLVGLDPQDSLAKRRLGELLLYALNRPEDAEAVLREAVALRPDDPGARASLGMALNALSRFPESVAVLEQVRDPAFFDTHPAAREALEASRKGERWPLPAAPPLKPEAATPSSTPTPQAPR